MARKKFKELDLKNAFLFSAVLEEPEICRMILEMILERPVPLVNLRSEHSVLYNSDFRSIRLDVYADDEMQVGYNLEMQNENEKNLPQRSRFHQAELDVKSLKPGEDFSELKPCYVIFICTFDPFGEKLYRYTFEERCLERDFPLEDGTRKIFLSTKGENSEDVPEVLVNFLKYVEDSSDACVERANNAQISELHDKVSLIKKSRELEERYMTLEEWFRKENERENQEACQAAREEGHKEGHKEGHQKGLEQGENRMLKLIALMTENGETELLPQITRDKELLAGMYKKYNL